MFGNLFWHGVAHNILCTYFIDITCRIYWSYCHDKETWFLHATYFFLQLRDTTRILLKSVEKKNQSHIFTLSNLFKLVQTRSNLFKLVQTCPNLSKLVQTCSNSFKLVQTCPNLSKLVQTCPNMSKFAFK